MPDSPTLHLSFDCGSAGATVLRVKRQEPPWRVVRSFPAPSGEALVHVHNVSGGILDTDSLFWRIDVAPGAQAQVTTTGATRVYRSRSAQHTAYQRAEVSVGDCGYLEYLPDQLIPFAGSRLQQNTSIKMRGGASLIWWERIAPGREASGETFRYESLASRFEVMADGEPIAIEGWTLAPQLRRLDSAVRLGPFRHFGSCYVCRAGEPETYWRSFESDLQHVAERISGAEILWGVTCLRAHGLVIRGVSTSGRLLTETWVEIWKAAKLHLCGRVAAIPRKVH
jgi:urease accessory protein